jgi:3-methyladenine DNA glycosylase AlkC
VTFRAREEEALLGEVMEAHPGTTKTALVEQGLRALLAMRAAQALANMGGKAPKVR